MVDLSEKDLARLLREVEEKFPEAAERARRLRERASALDPVPVVIEVGSEQAADDEVYLAQARLAAVIAGYGEGQYSNAEVNIARKQMAIAYARRSLAACRERLEAEGVRWGDVPDEDDWSGMMYA
jgi:hypothetical protein